MDERVEKRIGQGGQEANGTPGEEPFPVTFTHDGDKQHDPDEILRAEDFARQHNDEQGEEGRLSKRQFAAPLQPEGVGQPRDEGEQAHI